MLDQVKTLWRELSGCPTAFTMSGVVRCNSDDQQIAPPGWIGVVAIQKAAVVVTPTSVAAASLTEVSAEQITTPAGASAAFGPMVASLGPAILFYGQPTPVTMSDVAGPVPVEHPLVQDLFASASEDDRDESDLTSTDSGVFLATDPYGTPVAAAGYRTWPTGVAHMSVLTAPHARGTGHGTRASHAALSLATENGLLPQWRAAEQNTASIALAQRLGLTELGRQFSFQVK